jgi:thiol-disulfide isomerase/thioredoxin
MEGACLAGKGLRRLLIFALLASAVQAEDELVKQVVAALNRGDFQMAQFELGVARGENGVTPEWLEADSWYARALLLANQPGPAEARAEEILSLVPAAKHAGPNDKQMATAIGAAIEVKAQALVKSGQHEAAVRFLRAELAQWHSASFAPRIQKNLLLLTLVGQPAPPLVESQYIGPKPAPLAALRGKVVLMFFWAHWCLDCRAEVPILASIRADFTRRGLVLYGPTRYYGYTASSDQVSPAEELNYIAQVRRSFYGPLQDVPMPVSNANFAKYGASTTPTIVLIDRKGIVRLYHPGAMTEAELRAAIQSVI